MESTVVMDGRRLSRRERRTTLVYNPQIGHRRMCAGTLVYVLQPPSCHQWTGNAHLSPHQCLVAHLIPGLMPHSCPDTLFLS